MDESAFIVDIPRNARLLLPQAFKEYAYNQVRQLVHFDSGLWIEWTTDSEIFPHSILLFNLPPDMLENRGGTGSLNGNTQLYKWIPKIGLLHITANK